VEIPPKTVEVPPELEEEMEPDLEEIMLYMLGVTEEQLWRLQSHPELFPTEDIEKDFWGEVFLMCDHLVRKTLTAPKGKNKAARRLRALDVKEEQKRTIPARDIQRKPWEQFLNNKAPGSGADLSQFGEAGSIQLMPMSSVKIVMGLLDECRAAVTDIEEVRFFPLLQRNVTSRLTSLVSLSTARLELQVKRFWYY